MGWYDVDMGFRRIWIFAAVVVVVVLAAIIVVPKLFTPSPTSVSFSWGDTSRKIDNGLGVDSSGLRLAYRYELDPNSVDPLYTSSITGCSVKGKVSHPAAVSQNEEKVSVDALPHGSVVKETNFIYGNGVKVPVKYEVADEGGKFVVLFARYFAQENLLASFSVSCASEAGRQTAFNQVTDGIRFSAGGSKI